jgi:hypothetical protein
MKLEEWSWVAAIAALPLTVLTWFIDREQAKKFLKDHAGLIIAAFAVVIVYALWLRGWFNWLTHPVTWPVWVCILLGIAGLAFGAGIIYLIFRASSGEGLPFQISPFDYKTDEIFGVKWVWSFCYQQLNEDSLTAFCPRSNCRNRLMKREDHDRMRMRHGGYGGSLIVPISFTCRNCGFSHQFDSSWGELKRDVLEEVERRINTGEFRQRMLEALTKKNEARDA